MTTREKACVPDVGPNLIVDLQASAFCTDTNNDT